MPISIPHVQALSHFELLAHQIVEGFLTGLHKSPYHGFSVEFAEHKAFNQGDSTKNIDWKLFARTEKLYLKTFEEETNLRCKILLDVSASMNFPASKNDELNQLNKKGFSLYSAAALAFLCQKQRDAVGVTLFSEVTEEETPVKSNKNHVLRVIQLLEQSLHEHFSEHKGTQLIEHIHTYAELAPKRSMIVLFSDLLGEGLNDEALLDAFSHMKHNGHEVLLFHVFDQKFEQDFELGNKPYKLVDLETGSELKLNPEEFKNQFIALQKERQKILYQELRTRGVEVIPSAIGEGFEKILSIYLAQRSNLF